MKLVHFIKNLDFIKIQVRNLYIALLQGDHNEADDVVDEIDDQINTMIEDVDQLFKALGGDLI